LLVSGYQKRGFKLKVHVGAPAHIDDNLARKIVGRALSRLKRGRRFEQELLADYDVTRYVPKWSAANYTEEELHGKVSKGHGRTPAGQRFGGLYELRQAQGRDPNIGGELRESLTAEFSEESKRDLMVELYWYSDYLRYLYNRGRSRMPGSTVQFARVLYEKTVIPMKLRNEITRLMQQMGLGENLQKHIHIRKAGLIVRN
jgi:hypothetical protein